MLVVGQDTQLSLIVVEHNLLISGKPYNVTDVMAKSALLFMHKRHLTISNAVVSYILSYWE